MLNNRKRRKIAFELILIYEKWHERFKKAKRHFCSAEAKTPFVVDLIKN